MVTQGHLAPGFGPEGKPADARVQPVSSDHQICLTRGGMIEADPQATLPFLDCRDRIAEYGLDSSLEPVVDRGGEVGTPQACEAALSQTTEHVGREAAALAAKPVYKAHLLNLVTQFSDPGKQPHFLGNVVPGPPEVDYIAAPAKPGRCLDEERFVTGLSQQKGERRAGNARPVDDDPHAALCGPN